MTGRPAPTSSGRRPAKLSRDSIVNAALTFLDRDGWDALTINALATQLGTKGPSLYNHVHSLDDLRRTVRMRVVGDIIDMLNNVGSGRTRDDAVLVSDDAVRAAQRLLWEELRIVAEPSGATGHAALLAGAYRPALGEQVATLVCGANTDPGSVV